MCQIFKWEQQGFFYMHHPTDRITHTTVLYICFTSGSLGGMGNKSLGPAGGIDLVIHHTKSGMLSDKLMVNTYSYDTVLFLFQI